MEKNAFLLISESRNRTTYQLITYTDDEIGTVYEIIEPNDSFPQMEHIILKKISINYPSLG